MKNMLSILHVFMGWKKILLCILFCFLAMHLSAGAQQPNAVIIALKGTVLVADQAATMGMELRAGDTIQTQTGATVELELSDGSTLEIGENSSVDLSILTQQADGARVSRIKLLWGRVRAVLSSNHQKEGSTFDIETPNALAGVKFSRPVVEVSYNAETQETLAIAHSVELSVTNLLTGEIMLVPVGSSIVITPTIMKIIAGAATGVKVFGWSSGTIISLGVGVAAAGGVVAVVTRDDGGKTETAESTGDLSGTWDLQAQGNSQGCTQHTPCQVDPPYLCGIDVCGAFDMGDSNIQIIQSAGTFSMSGVDGNGNPFTLNGSINGASVSFTIQGIGITPGIGPALTMYNGTVRGNTIQGDFTGSASWQTPTGKFETATWSGGFRVNIQK